MGLGIVSLIKSFAPVALYFLGIGCFLAALSGRLRWALLLVTFLLPLRNVIDKLQNFPLGNQFIDILIAGMLLGWLLSRLALRTKLMERSPLNTAAVLLIVYTFVSLQIGNHYLHYGGILDVSDPRVQDWKNFCLLPILYFLTLNEIKDKEWAWKTVAVMCAAMLLSAYYTSTQVSWFSSLESRAKINGTFQFLGPNEVAAFFNTYTLILMSVYFSMRRSIYKILLAGLILFNLYCIVFLYSRGAYAATALGMFVLFAARNKKLLVPFVLALLLWQVLLPQKAIMRIQGTTNVYGELDESSMRRMEVWRASLVIFENNPVFGLGFGTFRHLGFDLSDTHNIYIKIMVEQGLIGMFAFLIVTCCFLYEGWRLFRWGDEELSKGLGFGLIVGILVLLVNNMFGDRWSYLELNGYLWIFAGLVTRLRVISTEAHAEKLAVRQKSEDKRPLRERLDKKQR